MRKALPEDTTKLVALMEEFYSEASYPLNHQRARAAFTALLGNDQLGQVWLIEAGSREVGHVIVTFCFSMEYGGLIAFVDDLFIQRPFRRAGLGTVALNKVRDFCSERGACALFVETGKDNVAAQALYQRVGFVSTGRDLLALPLADPTHV